MTDAAWAAFLDSLESELLAVQRGPAGTLRLPEFVPPADLGPLPRDLAARARTVLSELESTADVIRADMHRTTKQLRELRQLDPRGPKPASTFDSRA